MHTHQYHLTIANERLVVQEFFESTQAKALFILVHGAGHAEQSDLQAIADYLQNEHYHVLSFDFSGHGLSSAVELSSLRKKTEQLTAILNHYHQHYTRIYLLAFSMGGQIAINVVPLFPNIRALILCSPALYHHDAFDVPFNHQFSEIIRQPQSWQANNAQQQLANFDGQLHLVQAEYEDVIPQGVFQAYRQAVASHRVFDYRIAQANHFLGVWFKQYPHDFIELFSKIKSVLDE